LIQDIEAQIKKQLIGFHLELETLKKKSFIKTQTLNPHLSPQEQNYLYERINKKAQSAKLLENQITYSTNISPQQKEIELKKLKNHLIPNPCVQQEVEIMNPISVEDIKHTEEILKNLPSQIMFTDKNSIFNVLNGIAKRNNLDFVVFDSQKSPIPSDSYIQSTDFELENEIITEKSLNLLSSDSYKHQVKGYSLHLKGSLDDIPKELKKTCLCSRY
jgi:2-keto-4-pentenoate hydratase/2-oxohepta-3-ene-1,7-dioic acid hydratase in catechol pathway